MELINSKTSAVICGRDAKAVASDVDKYVDDNKYQYYLILNVMAYMLRDLGCDETIFLTTVERRGLLSCIDTMADAGTKILACYPEYPALELWISDLIRDLPLKEAAQVLRFMKRFTVTSADLLEQQSLLAFCDVNNANKMRDRNGYSYYLITRMREHIVRALRGIDLSNLYVDGYFSPGAVVNTNKSEVDKIKAWTLPNFGSIEYPTCKSATSHVSPSDSWGEVEPIWNDHRHDHVPCKGCLPYPAYSKAVPVPKSYKGYRIIAENDSTRQFFEQSVRVRMWDAMCRNGVADEINLRNQEINAVSLAIFGEDIATIDLSSASDKVPWSLVAAVFPSEVVKVLSHLRSWYVNVSGRVYPTYMAFTSGSALCFIVESLFFWSVTQVARDLYYTFTDNDCGGVITYVYGDDIVVSSCIYDTTCEILASVNAKVNYEKSYATGHFRESCGADWIVIGNSGDCRIEYMTSLYWPRKVVTQRMESVPSLLELNTRLFKYKHVHFFLRSQISSLCKGRMTFTHECTAPDVITDCLDLYEDTYLPCRPPYERSAVKSGILPESINLGKARVAELVSQRSKVSLDDPDVQMYYYTQYLMHGPLYEDALMELLGVSSPRRSAKSTVNGISFDVRVDPVF